MRSSFWAAAASVLLAVGTAAAGAMTDPAAATTAPAAATPAPAAAATAPAPGVARTAQTAQPGTFVAIPAVTVLRTLQDVGAAGPLPAQSTTLVQVAGLGDIPTSGSPTLSMTVTVSGAHAAGLLTVWPAGAPQPAAPTVGVRPGAVSATAAYVPVGSDGEIAVADPAPTSVQVTIVVVGYYRGGVATTPGAYTPVPATELGSGYVCNPFVRTCSPGTAVAVAGRAGIPADVDTVVVDVQVTSRDAGSIAIDSADPDPAEVYHDAGAGQVTQTTVHLAAGGIAYLTKAIATTPTAAVGFALYAVGYYRPGTPTAAGAFHALAPSVMLVPLPIGPSATSLLSTQYAVLPAGVSELLLDVHVSGSATAAGGVAVYPTAGPRPMSAQVAFAADGFASSQAIVAIGRPDRFGHGRITVRNHSAGQLPYYGVVVDGYFLPAA